MSKGKQNRKQSLHLISHPDPALGWIPTHAALEYLRSVGPSDLPKIRRRFGLLLYAPDWSCSQLRQSAPTATGDLPSVCKGERGVKNVCAQGRTQVNSSSQPRLQLAIHGCPYRPQGQRARGHTIQELAANYQSRAAAWGYQWKPPMYDWEGLLCDEDVAGFPALVILPRCLAASGTMRRDAYHSGT